MSGKLIPEFDRRRNIRDMFSRKPSLPSQKSLESDQLEPASSISTSLSPPPPFNTLQESQWKDQKRLLSISTGSTTGPIRTAGVKRPQNSEAAAPAPKRSKSGPQAATTNGASRGQQSLKGFFQAKSVAASVTNGTKDMSNEPANDLPPPPSPVAALSSSHAGPTTVGRSPLASMVAHNTPSVGSVEEETDPKLDEAAAEASKQSWGKLFSKPIAPKCEHDEPCKTMLTKKPGVNCGRSFWMCNRPLGPSGNKEKGTQWRCGTFIWASDWTGSANG